MKLTVIDKLIRKDSLVEKFSYAKLDIYHTS